MITQPFLVRALATDKVREDASYELTADDVDRPAVVAIDTDGAVLCGLSKITKVSHETTDDS